MLDPDGSWLIWMIRRFSLVRRDERHMWQCRLGPPLRPFGHHRLKPGPGIRLRQHVGPVRMRLRRGVRGCGPPRSGDGITNAARDGGWTTATTSTSTRAATYTTALLSTTASASSSSWSEPSPGKQVHGALVGCVCLCGSDD